MTASLACGLLIALFYDIYWLLIASRKRPAWLRAIQDMLFWLAAFCLIAALWLCFTGGVMRLYVYLWLGAGIILCRSLLSRRLRRLRPPLKLPPAARRPAPPQDNAARRLPPPPWLQYLGLLPASAMLRVGRGFWLSMAWSAKQSRRGCSWLAARLPRKKPPPEGEE